MSEKQRRILEVFGEVASKLPKEKKEYLLGYGEGMAAVVGREEEQNEAGETARTAGGEAGRLVGLLFSEEGVEVVVVEVRTYEMVKYVLGMVEDNLKTIKT